MRASLARQEARSQREQAISLDWLPEAPPAVAPAASRSVEAEAPEPTRAATFTLQPDLATAMLKQDLVAPGRLWFLLRHLDERGCGWVDVAQARAQLTTRGAPLRLCGWRQLRNLLAQGEGIFWQRAHQPSSPDRIWLRSPSKVALALGVERFRARAVSAPLSILLERIGAVRAHFYASFHSGREASRPIARQTLTEITGVSRRSQRAYEERAGVRSEHNWAVGNDYSQNEAQQRAWRHGRALFQLKDDKGKFGAAGASYVAWQMPNSYCGPHEPLTKNRKRRSNRRLTDLLNKGITGNGEQAVAEAASQNEFSFCDEGRTIRYYEHGRAAARSYNRRPANDHYWRAAVSYRRYKVWHLLAGKEEGRP